MSTENVSMTNVSTENVSTENASTENASTENASTENVSTENASTENEKIVVLMADNDVRAQFIPPKTAARINALGAVTWNPHPRPLTPGETADFIRDAAYCITGWGCPAFTEEVLQHADRLTLVAHTGGAVASLVTDALYDRGVTVLSGNPQYAESVAEGALAYILAGLRRLPLYERGVQNGNWKGIHSYTAGLLDASVGLLGFGAIARNLALMLAPFRVRLFAYDPYVSDEVFARYKVERFTTIEAVCTEARILSVHLPKTVDTYHVLNRERLGLLPDGALLVNTARGSVIDEQALAEELQAGRISAVLDVFEKEPLPLDSPLRGMDHVLLLPHMAGPTSDRFPLVTETLLDDIGRFRAGQPLTNVISRAYAKAMTNDSLQLLKR